MAQHVAPASFVIHEQRSTLVHLDVHVVAPAPGRPFWFLFTTGMSARPMQVPSGYGLVPHAELSMMLPEAWPFDLQRWKCEPRWYWPVRELLETARYPHRRRTWIGEGHTLCRTDPPIPFHSTARLVASVLLDGMLDEACTIEGDVATSLLLVMPIHADELRFKLVHGFEALLERMRIAELDLVVDPERPSCVATT